MQINMKPLKLIFLLTFLLGKVTFCKDKPAWLEANPKQNEIILPAADSPEKYLHLLKDKKVALVVNQTSILTQKNNLHLVDFLLAQGIMVQKVFVPEHGFRGT